ncbi:hypothetical protein [Thioalkalivibrio sp. XN279]|uniref:hypothetical protein n=1 Tax=Thioalkalivibrio sp. XN279 TaxID=2714953 RepID=UPI00140DCF26|nr:hypothetical protein [Thioalkalivibrio sp. XN279]NHA15701.1 hypothetical protein [Thioalkalivibrio sp. XN279]
MQHERMNSRPGAGSRAMGLAARAALLLAALAMTACGGPAPDPEGRLRAAIAAAEEAAEAGEHAVLAALVARDYADASGRDRTRMVLTIRGLLMRYPRLELIVSVREIELLSPQLARVRLDILTAGLGPAGVSADAFLLELSLRDEGDGWQVTRARWGREAAGGI